MNVSLRTLNGAIKKGRKTTAEIIGAYGFKDAEELQGFIRNGYDPKEATKLLNRLADNDERCKTETVETVEEVPVEPSTEVAEVEVSSETEEGVEADKDEILEAKLSNEVIALEKEHAKEWQAGLDANRESATIEDKIKALKQKVEDLKEKALQKQRVALEHICKMAYISEEHRQKQAELEKLRAKIAEKKKVFVFVGEDDTIEAYQSDKLLPLEFGNFEDAAYEMFLSRKYSNLTGKQLNMLAKLKYAKQNCLVGLKVEFLFDKLYADLAQYITE